jgi:hypothetical protein
MDFFLHKSITIMKGIGLVAVWLVSFFCENGPKVAVRSIYLVIYGIVFLVLWFAPREDQFSEVAVLSNVGVLND